MARKRRSEQEHELAVSDEAAAYIADALMQLALEFENTHYAQIRRHYETIAPGLVADPRQLDLFTQPAPHDPAEALAPLFPHILLFDRAAGSSPAPTADHRGRRAQTPSRPAGT